MEALVVNGLSKHFGGVSAVRNVSFRVEAGEHMAIIGPNGAGKTTLFNLLGGQLAPTSGSIRFLGQDITHLPVYHRIHLGMSRSFQIASLFLKLSILQNTRLALQGIKPSRYSIFRSAVSYKNILIKAEELLKSMDLWEKRNEAVNSISYGEQRKLEIVLSLAADPKLMLLDEPSSGLTAAESADIIRRIRTLGDKITVILVAHDMDLVFGVAQRMMVLHYGEIIVDGPCDEIRVNPKVKEIYMGAEKTEQPC